MLEILIPTHHKTKEQIIEIYDKLHLDDDALFANQNGVNETYQFEYKNHNIKVVCTDTVGISKNRNILLDNMSGDICICTDDDCRLIEGYKDIVTSFFNNYDPDIVLFNGIVTKENNRLVHNKKTKKVKRFTDVSYAGGPGFVFKREKLLESKVRFNEKLCKPNYICLGEDTVFTYDLVKSKLKFYRSKDVLFSIDEDIDNSSYFDGVDERFIISRGCILSIVHPYLKYLYAVKYGLHMRKWRGNKFSLYAIYKKIINGFQFKP